MFRRGLLHSEADEVAARHQHLSTVQSKGYASMQEFLGVM